MRMLQEGFVSGQRPAPWREMGRSIRALSLILPLCIHACLFSLIQCENRLLSSLDLPLQRMLVQHPHPCGSSLLSGSSVVRPMDQPLIGAGG